MPATSKALIKDLLQRADVEIGGSRPWVLEVLVERVYDRVLSYGTLGFGEAYMDGWWEAETVDQLIYRILKFDLGSNLRVDFATIVTMARSRILNLQRRKVFEVAHKHYDIGNELYMAMLDRRMIY